MNHGPSERNETNQFLVAPDVQHVAKPLHVVREQKVAAARLQTPDVDHALRHLYEDYKKKENKKKIRKKKKSERGGLFDERGTWGREFLI